MGCNSFKVLEYKNTMFSVICSIALYILPSLPPKKKKEIREIKSTRYTVSWLRIKVIATNRGIDIF